MRLRSKVSSFKFYGPEARSLNGMFKSTLIFLYLHCIKLYAVICSRLLSATSKGKDHSISNKYGKVNPELGVGYEFWSFVSSNKVTGTATDTINTNTDEKYDNENSPRTQPVDGKGWDNIDTCPLKICINGVLFLQYKRKGVLTGTFANIYSAIYSNNDASAMFTT